jgi:hypothetical protein
VMVVVLPHTQFLDELIEGLAECRGAQIHPRFPDGIIDSHDVASDHAVMTVDEYVADVGDHLDV